MDHRRDQAQGAHLEARALCGWDARVGGFLGRGVGRVGSMSLIDQFGRTIEYLRISITDRCNFRCSYCMPVEGLPWLPKADILSYDELVEFVRLTLDHPWHVRFIELMPVGTLEALTDKHVVPSDEVLERVSDVLGPMSASAGPQRGNGPAAYYALDGAAGTIGVI